MTTNDVIESQDDRQKQTPPQRDDFISKKVLLALGRPTNLCRIQVRRLWEDHYRVNVLVGTEVYSARIGHSYFLVMDAEDNIIRCMPPLAKQY